MNFSADDGSLTQSMKTRRIIEERDSLGTTELYEEQPEKGFEKTRGI
jgi:hypothetical protein